MSVYIIRVKRRVSVRKCERENESEREMKRPLVETRGVVRPLVFKYVSHPPPKNLLWRGRYAHIVLSLSSYCFAERDKGGVALSALTD